MPRKSPQSSAIREPLSYILSTPAKVAAVRALTVAGEPISQRDLARRAGVQHRSMQRALDDLVSLGVAGRIEGGREYLVSLNDKHRLTPSLRALFGAESEHFLDMRRRLAEEAGTVASRERGLLNVVLFGSVARGRDTPKSDCDVLIVARDQDAMERTVSLLTGATRGLESSHGCRIRIIGYTRGDAARLWKARAAPFNEIRRDALALYGPSPADSFNG